MSDEKIKDLCKDCGPTVAAFLERMAAHNLEQMTDRKPMDRNPKVTCPTCGKVHEYVPDASRAEPRAS